MPMSSEDPARMEKEILTLRRKIRKLERTEADLKEAEHRQYLATKILNILNNPSTLSDSIIPILRVIKQETGFDAVGIRMRQGDDFPYAAQSGFSHDFLLTENSLVMRDASGGPCKDAYGNFGLECTCGLVLSGKTDPANPLCTEGGSVWTNNSLPLLDLSAAQDPRLHPRNQCIHLGYRSIALIPIRAHGDIVGLLQLNDRRKNCFTLNTIQFFEGIGASIGVALVRKQYAEERNHLVQDLQEALSKVRLLNGLLPICSSCKKIRDDKGYWNQLESYIREHSNADFSHGLCPECAHKLYPELFKKKLAN